MKVKSAVAALAAALLALTLVGCGGTPSASSDGASSDPAADWSSFPTEPLILYKSAPADYADLPTVTPDELKQMMDSGEQMVIVDVNSQTMYKDGHIEGAINLPWDMSGFSKDPELPRGVKLVFYCVCAAEEDSGHMALSAVTDYAYRNIVLLKGGTPAWEEAGYELVK